VTLRATAAILRIDAEHRRQQERERSGSSDVPQLREIRHRPAALYDSAIILFARNRRAQASPFVSGSNHPQRQRRTQAAQERLAFFELDDHDALDADHHHVHSDLRPGVQPANDVFRTIV